jgi:hypothetical protein
VQVAKVLLKQSRQLETDPTKGVSEFIALGNLQKQINILHDSNPTDELTETVEEVLLKAMGEDLVVAGPDDTFALNISAAMSMVRTPEATEQRNLLQCIRFRGNVFDSSGVDRVSGGGSA